MLKEYHSIHTILDKGPKYPYNTYYVSYNSSKFNKITVSCKDDKFIIKVRLSQNSCVINNITYKETKLIEAIGVTKEYKKLFDAIKDQLELSKSETSKYLRNCVCEKNDSEILFITKIPIVKIEFDT